jgi:hypothetical protein
MAATATDFRSSQAPQRCSKPVGSVVRPMLVIIGVPGSFEWRPVRCLAGAVVPGRSFRNVRMRGRAHPLQCRKGKL